MTRKDFQIIAQIIANMSFHLKDGCFIIGDSQSYDALLQEDFYKMINSTLEKTNPNYDENRFWDAVDSNRKAIIDVINNH